MERIEEKMNINPEEINVPQVTKNDNAQMDDDSDMPEPETKSYEQYIKCTDKFMVLFMDTMGKLPYASVLKNNNGEQIKLIALVKFVETHRDKITIADMNHIVSFISGIEFKYARQIMEEIENTENQRTLWELITE